jgi:hypothetical protein
MEVSGNGDIYNNIHNEYERSSKGRTSPSVIAQNEHGPNKPAMHQIKNTI